jgi:hypothetical protein
MSSPILRNNKKPDGNKFPSYGSIQQRKTSPCGSIEEEQPLIIHNDDYPKATEGQRELLQLLKKEISFSQKAKLSIILSRLSKRKVERWRRKINEVNYQHMSLAGSPSIFKGLCWSFLWSSFFFSFTTLLITLGILISIEHLEIITDKDQAWETFLYLSFPWMAVTLSFLGCVQPIVAKVTPHAQEVSSFASPSTLQKVAVQGIEDLIILVTSRIEHVHAKLIVVIDDLRILFERAARNEFKIRMVDPDLAQDLPTINPCEVFEKEIQEAKEYLHKSALSFQQDVALDVASWIPSKLSSPWRFLYRECFTVFIWLVMFQGLGAYITCSWLNSNLSKTMELGVITESVSYLSTKVPFFAPVGERLMPFTIFWVGLILVEVYFISSLCLAYVVFVKTSISRTVSIINDLRQQICTQVNWLLLQNGIFFQCRDILDIRLSRVQEGLLKMVDESHRISTALSLSDIDTTDALSFVSDSFDAGEEKKIVSGFPLASPPANYNFLTPGERSTPTAAGTPSVSSKLTQPSVDPPTD